MIHPAYRLGPLVLISLFYSGQPALSDQRATIGSNSYRGHLAGDSAALLRFQSFDGQARVNLSEIERINVSPLGSILGTPGPARVIELRGGERISGALVSLDGRTATVELRGGNRTTIPLAAIAAITQMPAEIDVLCDQCEQTPGIWSVPNSKLRLDQRHSRSGRSACVLDTAQPKLLARLPEPLRIGRVALAFREPDGMKGRADWNIELSFDARRDDRHAADGVDRQAAQLSRIRVQFTNRMVQLDRRGLGKLRSQPVLREAGWRQFTALLDENGWRLLIDESLLASGEGRLGRLVAVGVLRSRPDNVVRAVDTIQVAEPIWIDDFQVQRFAQQSARRQVQSTDDVLVLVGGDEIFGTLQHADATTIRMSGSNGVFEVPWSEVAAILPRRQQSPVGQFSGFVARIEFQQPVDHRRGPANVQHPVLGLLRLPTRILRSVEPRFLGTIHMLAAQCCHLGDEVRATFQQPVPIGNRWNGEFSLTDLPAGTAYFSVDVAEMEPAAADTPPGSPYLTQLREGFLVTRVSLNGRPIGTLNQRITYKSPSSRPERIRLRIPAGVLVDGKNQWLIEQSPSRADAPNYDDCEIRRIALEVAH